MRPPEAFVSEVPVVHPLAHRAQSARSDLGDDVGRRAAASAGSRTLFTLTQASEIDS